MSEDQKQLEQALAALQDGKLIGLPTETVYGLAAPIDQPELIEKIFHVKERPFFDPLIVHVADVSQAKQLAREWPDVAEALAKTFWPGPLTLVLPKAESVSDLITSGLPTVGLRAPAHDLAREFLQRAGVAFAAPSANKFSKTSPTSANDVGSAFSEEDVFVLDGGACEVGIESTIVEINKDKVRILRPGMISKSQLQAVVESRGYALNVFEGDNVVAPGQMKEHYRPDVPLYAVTDASDLPKGQTVHWIELPDDAVLAARVLYKSFREASASGKDVCALHVDSSWLKNESWEAVLNRIRKAAAHFAPLKL